MTSFQHSVIVSEQDTMLVVSAAHAGTVMIFAGSSQRPLPQQIQMALKI